MIDEKEDTGTAPEAKEEIAKTESDQEDGDSSEVEGEDADEEGAETNSEDEGEETPEEDSKPAAKPVSRAQARIQKLLEENKSQSAEKEKLIYERAAAHAQLELLREQQRNAQNQHDRRAEEERLALLDPSERALYQANQQLRSMEYRLNQMEMQRKDDQDRANFHAKAAHDETYAKYSDKVEEMYQDGLKRGVSASREDLHSYILGRELKKDLATKVSKKKESASKRIDSVTSKPASARGDVAGSKKGKSDEDRLRGVLI